MKKIVIFPIFLILMSLSGSLMGQKFGHIHSAEIIEKHPKVAAANTELTAFQKNLTDPFEAKAKAFESKYLFFLEEVNAGTLSKISASTRQEELRKEQKALSTEEQQIQFAVLQKREQLLQPILTEVDSVIQVIGKENGYTMIFDTSVSGAVLFVEESNDLTQTVISRLNK